MKHPHVPLPTEVSPNETAAAIASVPTTRRRGGRISAEDGGGTSGQAERRRELRELFAAQFYKALKNPAFRFKSTVELAAEYSVTEKTIYEDVNYLRDRESLPIKPIRERGWYGFTEEVKAFAGDEFTRSEYLALWMSVQSFEAWGGLPQQKRMPGIMRKLRATSAELDPAQLARMQQTITFKAGGFQAPVDQGIFETVLQALLKQEELTFGYVSLSRRRDMLEERSTGARISARRVDGGSAHVKLTKGAVIFGEPELRRVQPLHLLCWEYAVYLFAWDHARADLRTFALGRMSDAKSTGVHFTPEVKFNLRKELAKSFGITRGGKAVRVVLRFKKRAIPLVIERVWHPSQEMIENEDGTLDLTMQVAIHPELVRWIQQWGNDVTTLEPRSLDDEVLEQCRKTLEEAARRRGLRWVIGS